MPAPGNENNALWKGITIQAWANNATNEYQVSETRKDFLPKSPEDYGYDFDGNLIKDGRWIGKPAENTERREAGIRWHPP